MVDDHGPRMSTIVTYLRMDHANYRTSALQTIFPHNCRPWGMSQGMHMVGLFYSLTFQMLPGSFHIWSYDHVSGFREMTKLKQNAVPCLDLAMPVIMPGGRHTYCPAACYLAVPDQPCRPSFGHSASSACEPGYLPVPTGKPLGDLPDYAK